MLVFTDATTGCEIAVRKSWALADSIWLAYENFHLMSSVLVKASQLSKQIIYHPVGLILDAILMASGVGIGFKMLPWAVAVGLDVYEFEPRVSPALMAMENVTLLPHLGTAALNVRQDMGMMAVDNLFAHLDGQPLPNLVV
jgi:hypothetical protein